LSDTLYACPSCYSVGPEVFHNCWAHGDISITRLPVRDNQSKPDGKHVRVMREDYTMADSPLGAIATVHGDGHRDLTVLPMVARVRIEDGVVVPAVGIAAHVAAVRGGAPPMYRRRWHDPELERMARLAARYDLRMAWSASAAFAYAMLLLAQKAGQTLNSDAYKAAIYSSNTMTPDHTVTSAVLTQYNGAGSQWVAANENSGSGYTAGGSALTAVTLAQSAGVITFGAANITWTTATISGYGDLVYDTSLANDGLCYNYFGGLQSVTSGTFTLSWPSGILTLTT
jgi:hypothetical protein